MKGESNGCFKLKNGTECKHFFFTLEPSHNQYKEIQLTFVLQNSLKQEKK